MRFLTNNLTFKLLAATLAFGTWSVVVYAGNPPQATTVSSIQVDEGPPPVGLVPLENPPTITVTIVGLANAMSSFHRDSLHASVDLSQAHAGDNLVRVRVDNADRNVSVHDSTQYVHIKLDRLTTVTRKLDIRILGNPANCCQVGTPASSPDTVVLKGAATVLQSAVAFAVVDVSGSSAPVQLTATVQVETPDHKPLTQVTAAPAQAIVSVPVGLTKVPREVPIHLSTTGQLPAGFTLAGISLSPTTVLVQGDRDVIGAIIEMDTDPVDLSGHTSDFIATLTLRPRTGVDLITKTAVTVHVFIVVDPRVRPTPSPSPSTSPSPGPTPT